MRTLARLAALPAAGAIGLATLLVAAPAEALVTVQPSITGSAPASAHLGDPVTFSYTISLPTTVYATSIATHQDAALPASATAVTLDNSPVPADQITRSGGDLTIQTGAAPSDGLAAGDHTLTFTAAVASPDPADTSSSATLHYSPTPPPMLVAPVLGGSVDSAPVTIAINQPDLSVVLTPDSGEDQVGLLGTGQDIDFEVDVANLGYGSPTSTLTLTLPTGTKLGADGVSWDSDGSTVTCSPLDASHLSCPLGALAHDSGDDPTLNIDLTTTPGEPVGTVGTITAAVAPDAGQGTDTDRGNDSVSAQLEFTGAARLSYTITPAKKQIPLGGKVDVTLTVHNAGPQPAPSTVGFAVVVGSQFDVVNFTGRTVPPPAALPLARLHNLGTVVKPGVTGAVAPGSAPDGGGSAVLWFVGDIPAGHSVTATLTLKARQLGTAKVGLLAISGAADPNCPNFDCNPTTVPISVVAVPAPVAHGGGTPISGGTGTLPDTGANTGPAVLGLGLLVAGAGLLLLGRRRPAVAARRVR